jgi:hypothetical protein
MSNWSDWLDWGGRPAPVRSLNNLYGPTTLGTPYQWLRPPGAPFPTPSGAQFPMFSPAGSPNYPMFGPNAGVPNVSTGAGPMPAMSWAERVATAGYSPATSTSQLVPMFDAAGNPSSIPRPMFDAAGNPTPITQTYSPGPGVPARPQVPGGATQFKTPLVPNQPSLMPNARPMNLGNPTRVPMFDAAGNLNPIPGGGTPYTPGPGVPTNPYTQAGASTAAKYPMFDAAGNPAPGPANGPRPPSLMPNARPMNGGGGAVAPTTTRVAPGTTPPGYITPGPQPAAPTPRPPAPTKVPAPAGGGVPYGPPSPGKPYGPPSPGVPYGPPSPAGAPTPAGSPTPGSPAAAAATQGRWNAFRTSTFGPSLTSKSPLGDMFTRNVTGKGAIGANIGTQVALQALPGLVGQGYTGITGNAPSEQGMETARSSANLAGLGLMFGVPVGAAAGVGGFVGDAVGSSGGLGVANMLRGAMGMDPTDDTIGDILGRVPGIGGLFGGGAGGEQQAADPVAALPPTPDSIATVGQMAGLDASSTGFLQQQFNNSVALSTAQYMADPERLPVAVRVAVRPADGIGSGHRAGGVRPHRQ